MRHLTADYIFPVSSPVIQNGIITVDSEGMIVAVSQPGTINQDLLEKHQGVICPGFINTHCHLELSHMKGVISEKTGMTGFIGEILGNRNVSSPEAIEKAMKTAEEEMIRNGIVAVADISNNNASFKLKSESKIHFHTFVEVFSMDPKKAEQQMDEGKKLSLELSALDLANSIVPHAPYTLSEDLLNLINEEAEQNNSIISIHNQESEGESELFLTGSGPMFDAFTKMGIKQELMRKTGLNSLRSTLPYLLNAQKILLVHNTFTTRDDIVWTKKLEARSKKQEVRGKNQDLTFNNQQLQLYWCTCPNANLYIENKLPEYDVFITENVKMTIGTDSLASNHSLSVLDELKTISKHSPHIPLQTLLSWACFNGAEFLGLKDLGCIEKGKRPGLNLLRNMNGAQLTAETEVLKLM
ncbi:MAG: amidohydrolase family protein [Bacteroidota bacterium]|nr:amidohydrolase family protein [Bacteroidota bacterium]